MREGIKDIEFGVEDREFGVEDRELGVEDREFGGIEHALTGKPCIPRSAAQAALSNPGAPPALLH